MRSGAEVRRPATVGRIQLRACGRQTVEVRCPERVEPVQARWVVDALPVEVPAPEGRRFEPSVQTALQDAAQRADKLREIAIQQSL